MLETNPIPERGELHRSASRRPASLATRPRRCGETEAKLRRRWRLISRAVVESDPVGGDTVARFYLEPLLVLARASQQGLLDPSFEAAAGDPRLLAALARCVDLVNQDLPRAERVTRFEVAGAEAAIG